MSIGKVWLVGAGPGNPELMTTAARRAIDAADVILYDSLVGAGVLSLIPPSVRLIDVGKRAGHAAMPQSEINETLLREAMAGNRTVRLKGGDPFLFGRGGEELELLAEHNIPFEIVPGVTSAVSVPAFAGIPVTHRDFCSSVHIITGHRRPGKEFDIDFSSLVKLGGTYVFLMGAGAKRSICKGLIDAGIDPSTPTAIIENGTTAEQRSVTSTVSRLPDDAEAAGVKTPAIIVVGQVAALSEKFRWADRRTLGGLRIILTRPRELTAALSDRLAALGAEVVSLPSIRTVPIERNDELTAAFQRLASYAWLVFTSRAGVDVFFGKLSEARIDVRALGGIKIAVIGTGTESALNSRGLLCDCVPGKYNAAALAEELSGLVSPGERVLIARTSKGSEKLTRILSDNRIEFDDIAVYDTVYELGDTPALSQALGGGKTAIVFTSASTVRGFVSGAGGFDLKNMNLTAVCIGAETEAEALAHGFKTIVSDTASIDGIVDKIIAVYGRTEDPIC